MIRLCAFADEASASVSAQIEALKRNSIGLIEVRGLDGENVSRITLDSARKYAEIFEASGIRVWSVGSPIGKVSITDDFGAELERLRHICRIAQIFGTDKVRIFSFFKADDGKLVIERLRRMVALASEYGISLYHENEKAIYGDVLRRVIEILDGTEGLRCVYDPANFIEVGENATAARHALMERIGYFHIKDKLASTSQMVPSGYGDGDICGLVSELDPKKEYVLTIEPHLTVFEGYSEIDGTEMKNKFSFESSDAAFDAAVGALKKIIISQGYIEVAGGYSK